MWQIFSSRRRSLLVSLCLVLACGSIEAAIPQTVSRTPLLIPSKRTLFQRVLVRSGVQLRAQPREDAAISARNIPPLTPFYVYSRSQSAGKEWVEIGLAAEGRSNGWIPAEQTLNWDQTLTVALAPPVNRKRVLFFRSIDDLAALIKSPNPAQRHDALLTAADLRQLPPGSGVIAVEPVTPPDQLQQFYVQPLLAARKDTVGLRGRVVELRIAAESLHSPGGPVPAAAPPAEALRRMRSCLAFAIDTTLSMDPYIDRVRGGVLKVYDHLARERYADSLAFAVVGFRNNTAKVPGLEYQTRVFSDFRSGGEGGRFRSEIAAVRQTAVSSDSFDEEPLAGIKTAITELNWQRCGTRYVVLVTDAGPKEGKASITGLDVRSLNSLARESNISIIVVHLLTEAGRRVGDHERARAKYRILSAYPGGAPLYVPIEGGQIGDFSTYVEKAVLRELLAQGQNTALGELTDADRAAEPEDGDDAVGVAALRSRMAAIGRSMQLQWLGREQGQTEPELIDAWMADRDPGKPRGDSVEIRTLISKDQLSQLAATLQQVLDRGNETRGQSRKFFQQLRSIPALVSRLPETVDPATVVRLADFGGIDELLEGLPYHSQLMDITEQGWISMTAAEQLEFLAGLDAKLSLYRTYNAKPDLWVMPNPASRNQGEAVMQIPLEDLP